jgi:hypothetical protein
MPKINTASDTEEQANNCALCTAAALTGQTSGDVNADLQKRCPAAQWGQYESDEAFITYARNEPVVRGLLRDMDEYQDLADQIIGLAGYVEWKLNTAVRYHGFPDHQTTAATALPFMRSQPDGTKFAVFTSLQIFGMHAHWIYAEKQGEQITFTDFQMDRQGTSEKPRTSVHPLGPRGFEYKVRGTDNTDETIYMFVLACGDTVGGPKFHMRR